MRDTVVRFGLRGVGSGGCAVVVHLSVVIVVMALYLFAGLRLSVAMQSSCYMQPSLGFRMFPYLASSRVVLKLVSSSEGEIALPTLEILINGDGFPVAIVAYGGDEI